MRPEHQVLATELQKIFQKSLQQFPSAEQCSGWWQEAAARTKACKLIELNASAAADFRDGRSRAAVINDPSFVHLFWLLELDAADVRRYLDVLLDKLISDAFPQTKFWSAYCSAIAAFSGVSIIVVPKPKLAGYEKFWEPYLDFMAGNCTRDEFHSRAAASFSARNRQSKLIDWRSLDGDAKNPVQWDFRYASLQTQGGHS